MKHARILVTAALAAAAFGAAAQDIQMPAAAAPPGASSDNPAQQGDRNRDGKVTRAEAQADAELARRFRTLDTDNSGKLDAGEFARFEIDDAPATAPLDGEGSR
jgi:hypothetical protein